jgi:predicted transcriptional regulator of viral defense system
LPLVRYKRTAYDPDMREPERLIEFFADKNLHSTQELEAHGFNRNAVKRLADEGRLIQFTRGIYLTPEALEQENLGLAAISMLREGAVCLLSAAAYHDIGDEVPPEVWFAVDRAKVKNAKIPSFDYSHQLVFWPAEYFDVGIKEITAAGQKVSITNPARTVVDLLYNRNKLTEEVALRAFSDFLRTDGDMREVWDIAIKLKRHESLAAYLNMADELKESIPQRRGP